MKKLLFIALVLLFNTSMLSAQNKKVELYELIKSLLPDSTQAAPEVSWNNLKKIPYAKWSKPKQNNTPKEYYLPATIGVTINGKSYPPSNSGYWDVNLKGSATGYTSISLSSPETSQWLDTQIERLFGKNQFSSVPLKNCQYQNGGVFYEVKISGKKPFWLIRYNMMGGSPEVASIAIECYFKRQDLNEYCK